MNSFQSHEPKRTGLLRGSLVRLLPAVLAVALAGFVGSTSVAGADTGNSPQNYEERLSQQVRHELVSLPWLSVFDNLSYSVNGSEVTLYGQTANPTLKIDANSAAKHIEGVTQVIDNIQLLPLSPMDDGIRRAEFRAIYGEPALERYAAGILWPIRIIVDNGHVTLEGVVNSESDKNLANIRANGVFGVFSVTNNLKVEAGH
jgi:hyperosmotically inducible periplasmic protein